MLNPHLVKLLAETRIEDLRRDADRARGGRKTGGHDSPAVRAAEIAITIRPARPEDAGGLACLADLDCARVPPEPMLVAEAHGEIRAALSLRDGVTISDPFRRTADARQLLTARAEQLRGERARHGLARLFSGRLAGIMRSGSTAPTTPSAAPSGAGCDQQP